MLHANLVERADQGSLEQAPDVLDPVGVDVTADPLVVAVVDALVSRIVVGNADVGAEFIGVDSFGFVLDVFPNELVQRALLHIGNALEPDLPVALQCPGNPYTLFGPGPAVATALLPMPLPSPNHRFVHFDDAEEGGLEIVGAHRLADTVAEMPRGLVGHAEGALQLVGADPLLALAHEIDRGEPFPERQLGVVEDRSRRDGKAIVAIQAMKLVTSRDFGDVAGAAASTTHAVGPAEMFKVVPADFLGVEPMNDVDQARGLGSIELFVLADVGLVN